MKHLVIVRPESSNGTVIAPEGNKEQRSCEMNGGERRSGFRKRKAILAALTINPRAEAGRTSLLKHCEREKDK
jgi:hypothetical protein